MKSKSTYTIPFASLILGLALLLTVPAWADSSYSFPRIVEGPATVISSDGDRDSVEAHMPLLVGDRLWVPNDSRLEVVLSDRGLLRIDGDSQIEFRAVAYSSDTEDRSTELHLSEGEMQLVVPENVLGDALPVVATPDATIYIDDPGTYRITVSRDGWTELVVRDGQAEITADREGSPIRAGEMAIVEGGQRPYFDIRRADYHDNLERWGDRLTREASYSSVPYVDESLAYVAAPLNRHGGWISIGGRHGWRPRVSVGWRPYSHGSWRSTPAGLTWVSRDSWGYVTHHYGSWDHVPGYGWVWYPGQTYSRARVHWYWGSDYVGWCPSGYYASYYGGRHGYGSSRGIYGWAGGSWDHFSNWSFTASIHFGRREQHRHVYSGRDMGRRGNLPRLDRGIITTDPGIVIVGHQRPRDVMTRLQGEVDDYRRTTGRDLPDVSNYVARKPLSDELRNAIIKPKPLAKPSKPSSRPAVTVEKFPGGSKPGKPGITTGRPATRLPRVTTDSNRDGGVLGQKPTTKPSRPQVDRSDRKPGVTVKPRAERPRPTAPRVERYESPRVTKPRATKPRATKPGATKPRETAPRVERYEAPRVTKPRATTPRATTPRATTPRVTKPSTTPRATTPRATSPRPQVTKPRAPAPRVERSSPPPPRVSKPSPPSKPKPSVKPSKDSKAKAKAKAKARKKKKKDN